MPIRVKIANTPSELDGLFKARHRVFAEEEGYFPCNEGGRIFDQFDSFPTTANLVAIVNQQVVGGLRLTRWSEAGTSSDDFFDFSPYVKGEPDRVATVSMFCLRKEYREILRLGYMMISTGVFWGLSKKLAYVAAAINPLIEPLVKAVGFKPLGPVYFDERHGVNVLPTLLEMKSIDGRFQQMANFQGFHSSLRTFDRELFEVGEKIIERGAVGRSAYVVIDGKVRISRPGRRSDDPPEGFFSRVGPCEIFGELALLSDQPQTSDAVAETNVDLMVIEKDIFWEQLQHNSDLQLKLLKLVGQRFVHTVENYSN